VPGSDDKKNPTSQKGRGKRKPPRALVYRKKVYHGGYGPEKKKDKTSRLKNKNLERKRLTKNNGGKNPNGSCKSGTLKIRRRRQKKGAHGENRPKSPCREPTGKGGRRERGVWWNQKEKPEKKPSQRFAQTGRTNFTKRRGPSTQKKKQHQKPQRGGPQGKKKKE